MSNNNQNAEIVALRKTIAGLAQHLTQSDSEITQLRERVAALQSALPPRSDDDAEIARLRNETEELRIQNWPLVARAEALSAKLSRSQNDVAQLLTAVEQQRQYIDRLKSQVEELLAWKRSVPVTPIERYICDGYGDDDATSDGDWKTILAWLDGMGDGLEVGQ